jgi:hypothetical protein
MAFIAGVLVGMMRERTRSTLVLDKLTKEIARRMTEGEYDDHIRKAAMLRAEREVAERYYKGGSG